MCLYPVKIQNKKYTDTIKNRGVIPPIQDSRTMTIEAGCGKCIECRKKKAREWQARLHEEIKVSKNGKFVTLTFSTESVIKLTEIVRKEINEEIKEIEKEKLDEDKGIRIQKLTRKTYGYGLDNQIATKGVRLFLERWRKEYKKSVRHWLVTELGHNGTENIHIHGILWADDITKLKEIWQYGYVWKGKKVEGQINRLENYVNGKTVNYIIKYVTKVDEKHKEYVSKILTSQGIGKNYINTYSSKQNRFKGPDTVESYRLSTGQRIPMPSYWRNKIYSEEEREKLWIKKLDENKKYIMGVKVENEKDYIEGIKYARVINKKLGYGSNQTDKEEAVRRINKQNERIAKGKAIKKGNVGDS